MTADEERYVLWNYMLAEQCLLSDSCDGIVQLTITPRTLTRALEDAGEGVQSPDDAECDFISAVATIYASRVLASRNKLRSLKSTDPNEVPFCTSFLALSVLAAFHMHTDEEYTGRAYYPRFAAMLGCELTRSYPAGFDGDAFLELWEELDRWLAEHYDRRLAAPDSALVRKYVAYPFAHVPLREVDIERLPQFFDTYGYEPGARAPVDCLAYDLFEGAGPWRYLTESGRDALQDPRRRPFVVRQVAHELAHWDGCRRDSSGARTASIEIWMDIRRRRAQLHLLARRPAGFPDVIEDGELVFESSQEGWYEPVPLSVDDGSILSKGLRIGVTKGNERYFLQLRNNDAVPFTPCEEYTGFISDRILRADTQCAVLCRESIVDEVARFLETLSGGRVHPRREDTIPAGWCLFAGIRPTNSSSPPAGLERLSVESSITLVPEGGLRLGRRWTWLEGAPARITVIGSHGGLVVKVDGQEAVLDEDGRLAAAVLQQSGQHVIEIGNRLRQRVTVLPGTVHPECIAWPQPSGGRFPVSLPVGQWFVVGLRPGEYQAVCVPPEGVLLRPSFRAHWALRVGSGPGAAALHLHDEYGRLLSPDGPAGCRAETDVSRPSSAKQRSSDRWSETIYQAGIRRPQLLCGLGCSPAQLSAAWYHLMGLARTHKRKTRRRRR